MSGNQRSNILDNIAIATPCSASWDEMKGDDRVRDCSQCRLSVYNLSAMSKQEAENLIREHAGKVCVRLYRRSDGTVITDDCPVALRKLRDSLKYAAGMVAAILSFVLSCSDGRADNAGSLTAPRATLPFTGKPTMGAPAAHPHSQGQIIDSSFGPNSSTPQANQGPTPPIHKETPKAAVQNYSGPSRTDNAGNNNSAQTDSDDTSGQGGDN